MENAQFNILTLTWSIQAIDCKWIDFMTMRTEGTDVYVSYDSDMTKKMLLASAIINPFVISGRAGYNVYVQGTALVKVNYHLSYNG